jgi:PST family polysaccharide transporter
MIKETLGIESLGIYAAVLPLATLWQIIPMSLNSSLAPFVARKKQESEKSYLKALTDIFKIYALFGWIVCIGTVMLSHWLVPLIFGASYKNGINVLCVYVFTNLFINMGMAHGLWMINEKKPYVSLINTTTGAVVCIVGNLVLIPYYGIIGAAISAVISQAFAAVISNIFSSKKIFNLQIKSLILL